MKNVLFHFLAIVVFSLLGLGLFLGVVQFIEAPGDKIAETSPRAEHYDVEEKAGNKVRMKMKVNDQEIMDFDFQRSPIFNAMRYIKPTPGPHKRHLILLGGSFAWSAGVADEETIHYNLQTMDPSLEVHNFAMEGLGPSSTLKFFIEHPDWPKHIQQKSGAAVYIYIPDHVGRVVGDLSHMHDMYENAYFYLDNKDQLQYGGSFMEGRPLLTTVLRFLAGFSLFQRFEITWPDPNSGPSQKLFCSVVKQMKQEMESRLKSSLFFAFFGSSSYDEKLAMQCLAASGIGSFVLHEPEGMTYEELYLPYDGHPNGVLTRHVAGQILEHTDRELKRMQSSNQE